MEVTRFWTDKDVKLMLDQVEKNYGLLVGAAHVTKKRHIINAKWEEITRRVNASRGESSRDLTVQQVKKKWFDMKCSAKREVNKWKVACKEGEQTNAAVCKPSDINLRIYNMPNSGANGMDSNASSDMESLDHDTALENRKEDLGQLIALNGFDHQSERNNYPQQKVIIDFENGNVRSAKRPKLETEYMDMGNGPTTGPSTTPTSADFSAGFEDISWQLAKSNYILETMSNEMKRSNDINEKLVTAVCKYLNNLSRNAK